MHRLAAQTGDLSTHLVPQPVAGAGVVEVGIAPLAADGLLQRVAAIVRQRVPSAAGCGVGEVEFACKAREGAVVAGGRPARACRRCEGCIIRCHRAAGEVAAVPWHA